MPNETGLRVAIVGFGPRGLGALEKLIEKSVEENIKLEVDIFDPFKWFGAGPNYDPDQSDLCILNIPVRIVRYEPPACISPSFKTFPQWCEGQYDADDYPARSHVGQYFHERYLALKNTKIEGVKVNDSHLKITDIQKAEGHWLLSSSAGNHGPYDEVLLTQGQPETQADPQIDKWMDFVKDSDLELLSAYPADALQKASQGWYGRHVGIRGLGLSTLDVVRLLTKGLGGKFTEQGYQPSGKEPKKIIPFSLDGKPPIAKPLNETLDKRYDPTQQEIDGFVKALHSIGKSDPDAALEQICDALIAPTMRILAEFENSCSQNDVRNWLKVERKNPGEQDDSDAKDALKTGIDMALDDTPPSVGYVVGQVWRKLQGELRPFFSTAKMPIETSNSIIGFDEGMKRYSYGPPVSAAQELHALVKLGLVSFCAVDDPDIDLTENGWLLSDDDDVIVTCMVNAVLPSPKLEGIIDPLVLNCVEKKLMTPISDGSGIHTNDLCQLVNESEEAIDGLSMLGRTALGSVIAVDGLDDCFGQSGHRWVEGVFKRL